MNYEKIRADIKALTAAKFKIVGKVKADRLGRHLVQRRGALAAWKHRPIDMPVIFFLADDHSSATPHKGFICCKGNEVTDRYGAGNYAGGQALPGAFNSW